MGCSQSSALAEAEPFPEVYSDCSGSELEAAARPEIKANREQVGRPASGRLSKTLLEQRQQGSLKEGVQKPLVAAEHSKQVRWSLVNDLVEFEASVSLGLVLEGGAAVTQPKKETSLKDFTSKGILGMGDFGVVELVEHKETKLTFALEVVSKSKVVAMKCEQRVTEEKSAQMMCDSEFIVKLYQIYSDYGNLYFLFELSLGVDVKQVYHSQRFYGSVRHTQFYLAAVVYALGHMHRRNIVFGDLKPESMLITETGYMKLTDFSAASVLSGSQGRTFTTFRTLEFSAPEVVAGSGYDCSADWWSFGILTFLLMAGRIRFENSNLKGCGPLPDSFPPAMRGPCESFVRAMVKVKPEERLPVRLGGIQNIQSHAWFEDFAWGAMLNMGLEPPYKPTVSSASYTSNFYELASSQAFSSGVEFENDGDGSDMSAAFATSY